MVTADFSHSVRLRRSLLAPALLLTAALLLSGCAASDASLQPHTPAAQGPAQGLPAPAGLDGVVAPLADYVSVTSPLATPTLNPKPGEEQYVTVATEIRANLRSGPATTYDIVAKVNPGAALELVDQSEDKLWYQVIAPGQEGAEAWISAELVRMGGSAAAPAPGEARLPADLRATWKVNWSCSSEHCKVKQCSADMAAQVTRLADGGYLPVEHKVTWADACFNSDGWTVDVDQATGQARSGETSAGFFDDYWLGANPGNATGVYPLDSKRGVIVYCSDTQSAEAEESDGWTIVYEGRTCHDVKTGMLVYMNYTKRWLFTGDFEGTTYERKYFGDNERLEQRLVETNVELDLATKR